MNMKWICTVIVITGSIPLSASSEVLSCKAIEGKGNEIVAGGCGVCKTPAGNPGRFLCRLLANLQFLTSSSIQNVFSRVTGSNISIIDGLLEVSGSNANLFFLNPNRIVFESNTSLNLGGSFLATTADRFIFDDGSYFSATKIQSQPLFTEKIATGDGGTIDINTQP